MGKLGVKSCGDLQKLSLAELSANFGSLGKQLYRLCRGIDDRMVVASRESKSLSVEKTFPQDLKTFEECLEKLSRLFKRFINRFEGKNKEETDVKTLFMKVKSSDFKFTTVERGFPNHDEGNFRLLLEEGFKRRSLPIRLLGLGFRFKTRSDKKNAPKLALLL